MEATTTIMQKFLNNIQTIFSENPKPPIWNSVAHPLTKWPSIYDESAWDQHPNLKNLRLSTWQAMAKDLSELKIKTTLDVGCASGQFVLLQLLNGIDAFGIDPRKNELFSNADDFEKNNLNPEKYLSLGDNDSLVSAINNLESKIEVDCVSFINFIHGWTGSDAECLNLFISVSKISKYVITSYPQYNGASTTVYLNSLKQIKRYNLTGVPHEIHYLLEF